MPPPLPQARRPLEDQLRTLPRVAAREVSKAAFERSCQTLRAETAQLKQEGKLAREDAERAVADGVLPEEAAVAQSKNSSRVEVHTTCFSLV